ncbi:MAG TPA: hypothetical protein VG742_14395 [Dongiaceae bacterium]|nr:hypothetical protein [Dongiaceae bacterium]
MGLLDLPAPFFDFVDRSFLGFLPPFARLVIWAALAAIASILIYKWLSPQAKIAETKTAAAAARRRLNAHQGDLESAMPLMRRSLRLASLQVLLVLPGALIGSLPVLALLVWLDGAYARNFPPEHAAPVVEVSPAGRYVGNWRGDAAGGTIEIHDAAGQKVAALPLSKPIPQIEQRHWWNTLIGNPAGYLPEAGPLERVRIALPEQEYLPAGPAWARSWFSIVLPVLLATSLAFLRIARIS